MLPGYQRFRSSCEESEHWFLCQSKIRPFTRLLPSKKNSAREGRCQVSIILRTSLLPRQSGKPCMPLRREQLVEASTGSYKAELSGMTSNDLPCPPKRYHWYQCLERLFASNQHKHWLLSPSIVFITTCAKWRKSNPTLSASISARFVAFFGANPSSPRNPGFEMDDAERL